VEYALGEKRSYVWVVSPDSVKGFELPGRNEIEVAANRLVNALTARSRYLENENPQQRLLRVSKAEADYSEASAALSKLVIDPIQSLLGRKRLVVVADGALQFVPFSALLIPKSSPVAQGTSANGRRSAPASTRVANAPLISEHDIVTLPSASVLALQRRELGKRKPAPLAVAILADPVFHADDERITRSKKANGGNGSIAKHPQTPMINTPVSAPASMSGRYPLSDALRSIGMKEISWLPFSRQEAEAIMKVAPKGETFAALDFKASRETANSPALAQYRILHIATHGVMDIEHPELSGIVLSMVDDKGRPLDGYLRLHEIYGLNLPAELVVLSACQTGVGKQIKGEGLIALTRGFMYAGAKSVVASYWKVDDKASSELMAEFYKQMFVNKLKPAAALRAAQIKISQEKRWASPHYWAGFFLQGEWN
jgi:CHAT domain-containing protein